MSQSLSVRSFLPGRVRFSAPVLVRVPELAPALQADLCALPGIVATANGISGGVLVRCPPAMSLADLTDTVLNALKRQLDRLTTTLSAAATAPATLQEPAAARPTPLKRLLASTEPHRALRRRAVGLTLANGLEDATPPLLVGLAVDMVTRGNASLLASWGLKTASSRLFALGGVSVGLWLTSALIEYLSERTKADLANAVRHDLRVALYERIQSLDVGDVEAKEVSDWMAIVDTDVNQIHGFIRQGVNPFFGMATNLVIVGITFVAVSPSLALMQLLIAPPLVIASKVLLRPIRERHLAARDDVERMGVLLSGNLAGVATIASFNTQSQEAQRVREASERFTDSMTHAERLEAVYVPTLRAIAGGGFVTSMVWGSAKVASGVLSAGALNTMALTQLRLLSALGRLGYGLDQYQRTANALERVYATLDRQPVLQSGVLRLAQTPVRGDIQIDNLAFGYQPGRPILKGINMRFPAGAVVGIVGASGAGKSTLMKLLMRFYDPQHGHITLDGHDLKTLQTDELRETMALVSQQVTLFAGTVRENIAYGRRDATLNEVMEAAKVAEAHDFVMALPQQYDTLLGFGGSSLSGGQRQRLAVARAVLANRPVLLFDEATSALDFETEAALQRSLHAATAGRTTIVVAHRLSTVRNADLIYVLDDGRVHEAGTHDELVAANGIYAGMWMVQTGEQRPQTSKRRRAKGPELPA